jgi:hypothetical protein
VRLVNLSIQQLGFTYEERAKVQGVSQADAKVTRELFFEDLSSMFDLDGSARDLSGNIRTNRTTGLAEEKKDTVQRRSRQNRGKKARAAKKEDRALARAERAMGVFRSPKQRRRSAYFTTHVNRDVWEHAGFIETDGVAISIPWVTKNAPAIQGGNNAVRRAPVPAVSAQERRPLYLCELREAVTRGGVSHLAPWFGLDKHEFVVADPGNGAPFTRAWYNPATGRQESSSISKETYANLAGRHLRLRRAKYDRGKARLEPILAEWATWHLKSGSLEHTYQAVWRRLRDFSRMHAAHSSKATRRVRFLCKRREASAIDLTINWLRGDQRVQLVVVGDGSRLHGMRGTTVGGPVAKIMAHGRLRGLCASNGQGRCDWRIIDEWGTSKMSWCCRHKRAEMRDVKDNNGIKPPFVDRWGKEHPRTLWTVRSCSSCRKLWNRDDSAARNIWELAWHTIQGFAGRPPHLTKG